MQRLTGWGLLRLVALPRVAPPVLVTAWMFATADGSSRPWAGVLVGAAAASTLLVADRMPALPLLAAPLGLFLADGLGGVARDDAWLALIVSAFFCVGRFGGPRHQLGAGVVVALFTGVNVLERGFDITIGDVAFPVLFTGGPWLLGLALQTAVGRAEAAADHAATVLASSAEAIDRATTEERLRIARDLHDVVAHNISALSLQAQTVRRRTERGNPVDLEELRAIEQSAQAAMTDLRRLLGVLRPAPGIAVAGPHEGIAQVSELVETALKVGQQVTFESSGEERELPPALSLATFRIVQESLANARKHAPGEPVDLTIAWSTASVTVEVTNRAPDPSGRPPGAGIAGMVERARMHGGEVAAGRVGDRWLVRARLPLPVVLEEAK